MALNGSLHLPRSRNPQLDPYRLRWPRHRFLRVAQGSPTTRLAATTGLFATLPRAWRLERSPFRSNRKAALLSCFVAFSQREPEPGSLENALGFVNGLVCGGASVVDAGDVRMMICRHDLRRGSAARIR
jgi:hypothetical protein